MGMSFFRGPLKIVVFLLAPILKPTKKGDPQTRHTHIEQACILGPYSFLLHQEPSGTNTWGETPGKGVGVKLGQQVASNGKRPGNPWKLHKPQGFKD